MLHFSCHPTDFLYFKTLGRVFQLNPNTGTRVWPVGTGRQHLKGALRTRDVFPQLRNPSASLHLQQEAEFWDRLMGSHYAFWLCSLSFVLVVWEHRAFVACGWGRQRYLHFVHYAAQVIAHFPISWLLFVLIHPPVEPFPWPSWSAQSPGLFSIS